MKNNHKLENPEVFRQGLFEKTKPKPAFGRKYEARIPKSEIMEFEKTSLSLQLCSGQALSEVEWSQFYRSVFGVQSSALRSRNAV